MPFMRSLASQCFTLLSFSFRFAKGYLVLGTTGAYDSRYPYFHLKCTGTGIDIGPIPIKIRHFRNQYVDMFGYFKS